MCSPQRERLGVSSGLGTSDRRVDQRTHLLKRVTVQRIGTAVRKIITGHVAQVQRVYVIQYRLPAQCGIVGNPVRRIHIRDPLVHKNRDANPMSYIRPISAIPEEWWPLIEDPSPARGADWEILVFP